MAIGLARAQEQGGGSVSGRVTDSRGQPERVLVHLLTFGDIPAGDTYTDSNGVFSFRALPSGDYNVVIDATGFRPVRHSVSLDQRISPKVQVVISLEPADQSPGSNRQIISGSGKSHEINAKAPTRPFHPKALHEFERANDKQRRGDLAAAIAHYRKALEFDPDFYPALNNLGAIYLRQKDAARAEEAFLKALTLNSEDSEVYFNLGHALYEEGRYSQAAERLEEGLKRSPRSALGLFFLGSAYLRLGDLKKAEANLKSASSMDPAGMPAARLQLANVYLKRHDTESASVELRAYLEANPSDPQAPAIKKMLADLKVRPAQ